MIRSLHIAILSFALLTAAHAQHPSLSLTPTGVERIRAGLGTVPLFDQALQRVQQAVDWQLEQGAVDIPVPKDMAGGYTHEQHKYNYKLMHQAGNLYQITGDERYATLVRDMLLAYADLYPTLPLHPTKRSYATGKLFWQCLNDANWLVFTSQAYDCIYDFLSEEERTLLEEELFIPFANFLSVENPRFFNRIHNHSTWANAAVGMMALAMDNDTLLEKALYGLQRDEISPDAVDNDGGLIKKEGVTAAGFLAQLDYSFSPEGYFAEGPYYQRYAIFPFLKFSQALHNKKPALNIFQYREGILKKATHTLLQLTDSRGQFFPINDAQKGMSFHAYEVITAIDLLYFVDPTDTNLLNWATAQGQVTLDEAGFVTAQALQAWEPVKSTKTSVLYGDGVSGEEGGVAVLRAGDMEVLFKYATQGMGHGHFDRLSYSLYDEAGEIVQDYGAVRWVNVDQKAGGRYLPENKTFGKQTIGHNALVVNHTSHFAAEVKAGEVAAPQLYYADIGAQPVQMISAIEDHAYVNTSMQRTLFLVEDAGLAAPILLDIMNVQAPEAVTLDLPLWYIGDVMKSSFTCPKGNDSLTPLGEAYGYQHIWQEATCTTNEGLAQFNWFGHDRFYTLHTLSEAGDQMLMGRLGANDPNYNLRPDPVLIHRRVGVAESTFISLIESHGRYDRSTEIPQQPYGQIQSLKLLHQTDHYMVVSFASEQQEWVLSLSLADANPDANHSVQYDGGKQEWKGIYNLKKVL